MKNMGNNWMQAKDCKIRYDLLTIKFAKKRLVSKPSEKQSLRKKENVLKNKNEFKSDK